MSTVVLNLSRKWRSQDFDHIVGQDLAVRILKNSLYLGHFFPVYLFAGQRGCGKTSMARIFAAAVNCESLVMFQKDPKKAPVPCLLCASCVAMREGNHPDFVEIDAASHTGVDNIRTIIETSSLLPIMGGKRVYLIDEAHMLSKAAFNAALKILEEPPATALFILATTNQHKIIDTVRSRCFQLFFTPIPHDPLKAHLQLICKQEKIAYSDEALDLMVQHSEGSARDALNLLEQVRFSNAVVNKEAVLLLLGHIDDQQVLDLIRLTLQGAVADVVAVLDSLSLDQHKAEFVWQRMVALVRSLLWIKHGVSPREIASSCAQLEIIAAAVSLTDLHRIVEALYAHEELFLKTAQQHIFLEMILLGLCSKDKKKTDNDNGSAPCALGAIVVDDVMSDTDDSDKMRDAVQECVIISDEEQWKNFVEKASLLSDQLVVSLFKQARFIAYDKTLHCVSIEMMKDFILFKESLEKTRIFWQPMVRSVFADTTTLDIQFTGINKVEREKKNKEISNPKTDIVMMPKKEIGINFSDETVWKNASMLLRHFPGVITEIRENR